MSYSSVVENQMSVWLFIGWKRGEDIIYELSWLKFKNNKKLATTNHMIYRDLYGSHDRLVAAYFPENQLYDKYTFRKRFLQRPTYTDVEKLYAYHEGEYVLEVNLSCIYAI